jgi:hypothetical protein
MIAPAEPDDRQDLHNASVDKQVADAGRCGQVHLATGRTCTLEQGHSGSCDFASPDKVEESLPDRRPDDG